MHLRPIRKIIWCKIWRPSRLICRQLICINSNQWSQISETNQLALIECGLINHILSSSTDVAILCFFCLNGDEFGCYQVFREDPKLESLSYIGFFSINLFTNYLCLVKGRIVLINCCRLWHLGRKYFSSCRTYLHIIIYNMILLIATPENP